MYACNPHRVSINVDSGTVWACTQHLWGPEELGSDAPQALSKIGGNISRQEAEFTLDVLGKTERWRNYCIGTHMHVNPTGYEIFELYVGESIIIRIYIGRTRNDLYYWLTLNRDEKTWKVWTAQDPSKSVTSWLTWQRQASSASSHTVGWKAAKMAEKNGEGGGGKPRSSKSSTSSRKLKMGKKWRHREKCVRTSKVWDILDPNGLRKKTNSLDELLPLYLKGTCEFETNRELLVKKIKHCTLFKI